MSLQIIEKAVINVRLTTFILTPLHGLKLGKRLTRSLLLAFTLGEAFTDTTRSTVDDCLADKEHSILAHLLVNDPELHLLVVLLRPFNQTTLIVLVRLCHLLNVTQAREDPVKQKATALFVPLVDIYGTDKRLERITVDIAVMLLAHTARVDKPVNAYFNRKLIETFAADKITAGLRKEALSFLSEIGIEEIGSDGTEDSISKELKTLIATELARPRRRRTVRHGQPVQGYIVRNKSQNRIQ